MCLCDITQVLLDVLLFHQLGVRRTNNTTNTKLETPLSPLSLVRLYILLHFTIILIFPRVWSTVEL